VEFTAYKGDMTKESSTGICCLTH